MGCQRGPPAGAFPDEELLSQDQALEDQVPLPPTEQPKPEREQPQIEPHGAAFPAGGSRNRAYAHDLQRMRFWRLTTSAR